MATVDTSDAGRSDRRRCPPTRCGGWSATSPPSGGGGASSRPGRGDFSLGAHPPDRPRPAAAAARRLRRVRADLQHAAAPHPGRLHARPGGQPLRHRRPPGELPLARVELRRPDPAARRRPADGRRRLPRPRPGDHDARLPPRAGRGRVGGDGGRGRGGDRRRCGPARWSTSTTGCATWRCGSRCGRCSGSTPTRPARAPPRPSTSSARSATTASTTGCGCCAGPGSPWRKLIASRQVLDEIVFGEIARRRAAPDPEPPRHPQPPGRRPRRGRRGVHRPRDPRPGDDPDVRRPRHLDLDRHLHAARARPPPRRRSRGSARSRTGCSAARRRRSTSWSARCPTSTWSLDEVLRLYPPAWIGPRRAVRDFEFGGYSVPRGAYVNYCSWASHRLPEVFPEPEAFIPERFTRERKAALPRGAYVPFGGGQRICIGKRFGQTEVKLVTTMLLQRLRLDALPGRTMTVRQMPTLSPQGGLRMRVAAARRA